jgi:hypothetical protein
MQYYPSFNFNYPLNKRTPKWFPKQSKEILKEVNSILKYRTKEEIEYAFLTINWIRERTNIELSTNINHFKGDEGLEFNPDFGNYRRKTNCSPSKHLKRELKTIDITGQKHFPNATFSEYLAVLALALISELFNELNFSDSKTTKDKKDREIEDLKTAGSILIDAKEAIGLSEKFSKFPPQKEIVEKEANKLISLRHQENAIKGNLAKRKIGDSFLRFRQSKEFPSDISAINQFMETLPDQQKNTLPKDYKRFFRNKIRAHRKDKPSP